MTLYWQELEEPASATAVRHCDGALGEGWHRSPLRQRDAEYPVMRDSSPALLTQMTAFGATDLTRLLAAVTLMRQQPRWDLTTLIPFTAQSVTEPWSAADLRDARKLGVQTQEGLAQVRAGSAVG